MRNERYRKAPRTPRTAHARQYYTRSLVFETPIKKKPATPRARCYSAPKVMDNHSRSASPRDPMRPQHRPPSPPSSPAGFDNRAYQHDESDPNHNESFASNGPHQNGHTKEQNGVAETKTLEAVNLELINLTPKNGNAKKDVDVEMNSTNPYDEYFVPVNEHRKYMRGEKLYVTADKRGENGGCKRPLCWTLVGLVVAAVVAVIVLSATGIIFSNSPSVLEQYNNTVTSARALGGIGGHIHHDHNDLNIGEHDHQEHDHHEHNGDEHSNEPVEQHGPETQSDEGQDNMVSDENGDSANMYVPRTLEGVLKVDNEEYTSELQDLDSNEYSEFVTIFSDGLKRALFDKESLENGDNEITVEVIQLRPGSVIVTYRVHWKPKSFTTPTEDLLSPSTLKKNLNDYLNKNNRMINVYHIAEDKMSTSQVLNVCQINKNGCEHGCEFDESTLDFICTCPYGQVIDIANPKVCISLLENKNKKMPTDETSRNIKTSEDVPAPTPEHPERSFDWQDTQRAMPEVTTDADTEVSFSQIFGHPTEKIDENKTKSNEEISPEPTPEPKPTAEPSAEPAAEPAAEPTAEPAAEPSPVHSAESATEPSAEPSAKPTEPSAEPAPEPFAEPTPEPSAEPSAEVPSDQSALPVTEPSADSSAEPTTEPAAEPAPEPSAGPAEEPAAEPAGESSAEATAEPAAKPAANPATEMTEEPSGESIAEPEPTAEPAKNNSDMGQKSHVTSASKSESDIKSESSQNLTTLTTTELSPKVPTLIAPEEPLSKSEQIHEQEYSSTPTSAQSPSKPPSFSDNIHSILDSIQNGAVEIEPESESVPTTDEPKPTTEVTTKHQSEDHSDEEKSILYTNEGKFVYKPSDTKDMVETTPAIKSESNNNEPSDEGSPDIISILTDTKEGQEGSIQTTTMSNKVITTTDSDMWLEDDSPNNIKASPTGSEHLNETDNIYAEILNKNKIMEQSEPRGFKSFDDEDFLFETTTTNTKPSEMNVNDSFETMSTTTKTDEENKKAADDIFEEETKAMFDLTTAKITTVPETITNNKNDSGEEEHNHGSDKGSITSILEEVNSLGTNVTVPVQNVTAEPEQAKKHDQEGDDNLMDMLSKKPYPELSKENSTESEEGMDITFDSISKLYNRSSKSIHGQTSNATENKQAEDVTYGETLTTTETDWLSEPVTEMNYRDAVKELSIQTTPEPAVTKIDDLMHRGLFKDDFEPDYLSSSMHSGGRSDDEPLYSMVHDYDNEDSRYKRVNKKEINGKGAVNVTNDVEEMNNTNGGMSTENSPIETTTVSEYIYKVADRFSKVSVEPENKQTNSSVPATADPAPVWEESEIDRDLRVKELPNKVQEPNNMNQTDMIDEIKVPAAVTTVSPSATNLENEDKEFERAAQNATQLKNLNVTIYEISSHISNQSISKSANAQSAEYDDHEIEMNPFLPDVENNKILVKKLQEGHDLEPVNLNETQNENAEEHISTLMERQAASNNDTSVDTSVMSDIKPQEVNETQTQDVKSNNDEITLEKLMKESENYNKTVEAEKDTVPISSFFLDTDDLVTTRGPSTPVNINKLEDEATSTSEPLPALANIDQYLSVVPVTKEKNKAMLKDESEVNEEKLNDISHLTKSDKTLDTTKFDSVITNET